VVRQESSSDSFCGHLDEQERFGAIFNDHKDYDAMKKKKKK